MGATYTRTRGLAAAGFLSLAALHCASRGSGAVEIRDGGSEYEVTASPSRVVLSLPKDGWTPSPGEGGGAADSPRYFQLQDRSRGLILSGWMEAQEQYPGIRSQWDHMREGWKRSGLPDPLGVTFEKRGDWEAVMYDMPMPAGSSNTNVWAEWVGQGTWIEVHVSLTSALGAEDARKRLREAFDRIRVRSK